MNAEPGLSTWHTASFQGTRGVNADAVASGTDWATGRLVVALADGIGDRRAATRAALTAAGAAVGAPVASGPVAALAAAGEAVRSDPTATDCVIVLAQPVPTGYRIAWVGDVRAYGWYGTDLVQLTRDHTVAEYFRSRGAAVTPRMEHTVVTSMRTAEPAHFGHVAVPTPAGLLLTTDGVHRTLGTERMAEVIRGAFEVTARTADPAAALVAAARAAGATDNATAVMVGHPYLPPTTPQPTLPVAA